MMMMMMMTTTTVTVINNNTVTTGPPHMLKAWRSVERCEWIIIITTTITTK